MSGTVEGGKLAAKKNTAKYGKDYYSRLGKMGAEEYRKRQKLGIAKERGFGLQPPEKRAEAGRLGGQRSKRGKAKKNEA